MSRKIAIFNCSVKQARESLAKTPLIPEFPYMNGERKREARPSICSFIYCGLGNHQREHRLHVTTSSLSAKYWPMSVQKEIGKKRHSFANTGRSRGSRRIATKRRNERRKVRTNERNVIARRAQVVAPKPGRKHTCTEDCTVILYHDARRRMVQLTTGILLSAGSEASADSSRRIRSISSITGHKLRSTAN